MRLASEPAMGSLMNCNGVTVVRWDLNTYKGDGDLRVYLRFAAGTFLALVIGGRGSHAKDFRGHLLLSDLYSSFGLCVWLTTIPRNITEVRVSLFVCCVLTRDPSSPNYTMASYYKQREADTKTQRLESNIDRKTVDIHPQSLRRGFLSS